MSVEILQGDCLEVLRTLPAESVHSVVTDPPYHLTTGKKGGSGTASLNENSPAGRARIGTGFMGMKWDGGGIAHSVELWTEVLRVAKPGAHLLAFGGTRTFHRLTCAIEDAGWEIRDCMMWVYGSGFPKSLDVSKAIDKAAGAEREVIGKTRSVNCVERGYTKTYETKADNSGYGTSNQFGLGVDVTAPATESAAQWDGWGTALKPAWEPIIVARKPLDGTVAENVLKHGTGALNIDACRIAAPDGVPQFTHRAEDSKHCFADGRNGSNKTGTVDTEKGRWPANLIHDGSEEVLAHFPGTSSGELDQASITADDKIYGGGFGNGKTNPRVFAANTGSAARFFYCSKASTSDREPWNTHPTVKPTDLMSYLVRLVTVEGGTVLDPFFGSGTTGIAARRDGCKCIGIELNPDYIKLAKRRLRQKSLL